MIDIKAASTNGKGKHRIIWDSGLLIWYDSSGIVKVEQSEAPVRIKSGRFFTRQWKTSKHTFVEKCWHCGGWHRVAYASAQKIIDEVLLIGVDENGSPHGKPVLEGKDKARKR